MKGGIVGLGKMGMVHYGILNSLENVNIVACCEKEKLITNNLKKNIPLLHVYENFNELIDNEELDFLYITTPLSSHLPMAETCIKKGINFFIEKPLVQNSQDSKKLCQIANNSKLIHEVGYCKRFLSTFEKGKELIDKKILGKLVFLNSNMYVSQLFTQGTGWRYDKKIGGGGVLMDHGVHLIDMLLWYFGDIVSVEGKTVSHYSKDVEDFAHSLLTFNSGLTGFLDISWSVQGYRLPEMTIMVHGENGMLKVNEDHVLLYLDKKTDDMPKGYTKLYRQDLETGVEIDIAGPEYTKEDIHFLNSIKNQKQTSISIFEASKIHSVIDSIYESNKTSKMVEVNYNA